MDELLLRMGEDEDEELVEEVLHPPPLDEDTSVTFSSSLFC